MVVMVRSTSMQRLIGTISFLVLSFYFGISLSQQAAAISTGVVIAKVQVAGATTGTSAEEYVSIYNNTAHDIDITGWCLNYNLTKISCFTANTQTELYLSSYSSAVVMNPTLDAIVKVQQPGFTADALFSSSSSVFAATNGSIQLVDNNRQIVDVLGWGSGGANGQALAANIPAGKIIKRIADSENVLRDTKTNNADFELVPIDTIYPRGGIYEQQRIDVCPNIPGLETVLPAGYMHDEIGNCYQDRCSNIQDLQIIVPPGYTAEDETCTLVSVHITEVLPNALGSDTGKEFIELFNPNAHAVSMAGYSIQLNPGSKRFVFSNIVILDSGEYRAFSDLQLGITLPNTTASVQLFAPDGTLVYETGAYVNPKDDASWSYIENQWQYTTIATPGAPNEREIGGAGSGVVDMLDVCPEGKYRNPETNRCKNIEVASAVLVPCAADQERNPATNRCRKIASASSSLVPCKEGQVRNPETNRCKKNEETTANLKPCAEGQERNPETNRCRKAGASASGSSLDNATDLPLPSGFRYRYHLIGLLSSALIGYGAYEYRTDIKNYAQKVKRYYRRGRPPG
jgi:hypothetical protein